MKKIELLDCTLRDGAYIVDSRFGSPAIKGIIKKMQDANVDIIECGWLKNGLHTEGSSFYHVPDDLKPYLIEKNTRSTYTVMIDWDRYDLDLLPPCDGETVDAIRVVFPHGRYKEGIAVGNAVKEKGYQVFYQAANTLAYSDEELRGLAEEINRIHPSGLSVVDTFGAMYEEDLERITDILDKNLDEGIKLGFHSHNNQQLSFALTIHFVKMFQNRKRGIIVDASLNGMGRGAGNTPTELIVNYLNRNGCSYEMDSIMAAIDIYMEYFKENYEWGYSTPYFIAGMYCCHVNNIAYLLQNHRTSAKDMRSIIESLQPEDRRKYDYDLLEEKYIENQNKAVDDEEAVDDLKGAFRDRTILLIAPGKSAVEKQGEILEFIRENKPVVIAVNALLGEYSYDYMFVANSARYDYAKESRQEQFGRVKKIVLSNIKTKPEENEYIISFNRAIKRGWEHFDNAVICCLRLLDKLEVEHAVIAGFDGFKTKYNESYADTSLPAINPGKQWDELNKEIKSMFTDVKQTANVLRRIEMLTESYFTEDR
ncbi:4-hydroxy-2-oxovalerate aldolase [Lachnospiraceae bacterium]|nr:4-hydroxy-2-oxovalerate aldolase [Lachnospiraceae bacterium]